MLRRAVFDMDGVIFDTERLFMRALIREAAKRGYALTEEIYAGTIGVAAPESKKYMKERFGEAYPYEEASAAARKRMESACPDGFPVKEGIRELLRSLRARGTECVVASSTRTEYVKKYISKAGLEEYFLEIIGGDMVSRSKPAPDIFIRAIGNVPPSEAVVLEDSANGVRAALEAGIRVICVPDLKPPPRELLDKAFACVKTAADAIAVTEVM